MLTIRTPCDLFLFESTRPCFREIRAESLNHLSSHDAGGCGRTTPPLVAPVFTVVVHNDSLGLWARGGKSFLSFLLQLAYTYYIVYSCNIAANAGNGTE